MSSIIFSSWKTALILLVLYLGEVDYLILNINKQVVFQDDTWRFSKHFVS
jgi:hypothetical protein